jgi:lipopolysaccharide export system permease protein
MNKTLPKILTSAGLLLPRVTVMDRYLTLELMGPFLFGVGAFSSVGVAIGALFDLVRRVTESGLPMEIAVKVFLLKMPDFIVLAFPMSVLLSTLMTYSRLSSDSELIALRSCGVSIYRLVLPAIVLSCFVTGLTFVFNEQVVPAANYQATKTLEEALKRDKPAFQENNIFYPEYRKVPNPKGGRSQKVLTRLFYAENFDGQKMKGLTILDRSRPDFSQMIVSESASWNPMENTWDFFNGTVYILDPKGSYRNIVRFSHQKLELPRTALDLAQRDKDYTEMNIAEAQETLELIRFSGDDAKIRKLRVRIQQKYALPFVCIVFGMVGAALGTRPQRTGKATSFGISVIIIFGYYLLAFITGAMGQTGVLTPFMAAWLPTLLGFGVGVFFLVRASR